MRYNLQMRHSSCDFGFTSFSFPSEHHGGQQAASPAHLDHHAHQGHEPLADIPTLNHLISGVGTSKDSPIALTTVTTPSAESLAAAPSFPNPVRDLYELCSELVQDQDVLDAENTSTPGSPWSDDIMEAAAQRALRRTARLTDILKDIAVREQVQSGCTSQRSHSPSISREPSSAGSFAYIGMGTAADPSSATPRPKRSQPDPVLITAASTAYILLIRTWRHIFLQLHRLLLLATTNLLSSSERAKLPMLLPSLQLGGFTVQNNPTIQVVVLLELVSSMLKVVEGRLGIAEQWPRNQAVDHHPPHHQHQQQTDEAVMVLKPFTDPMAISIRETLLSQEVLRIAAAEDDDCGLAQLSLRELMDEIKRQV